MPSKYNTAALILIIAIAIFFRFWQFNSVPPGLYQDEAMNGADAISSLQSGKFSVFYQNNNGREGMIVWLDALAIKLFGVAPAALRLFPEIAGVLAVLGLYFLAKLLFGAEIALVSAFFMSTSFWAVNFSRIGFRAGLMVPFLIWSFYFLLRGFKSTDNKIINFIFAGILFGLGFYTYISYRFAPVLALLTLLPIAVSKKSKKLWIGIFIFIATAFIAALPIGLYFIHNPGDFFGRASEVAIWSQKAPVLSGIINVGKTLAMFNIAGDFNWRHNYAASPELFLPVGLLFLLGIYFSVRKFSFNEKFLLAWLFVFILPDFLTTEGNPHALRALGALPAAMIFAGIGFMRIYDKINDYLNSKIKLSDFKQYRSRLIRIKKEIFWLSVIFLIFTANFEFNKYFNDWAHNPNVASAFSQNQVKISDYFNNLPRDIYKYAIWPSDDLPTGNGLPVSAQTVYFLTIGGQVNYLKSDEIDKIKLGESGTVVAPIYFDLELIRNLNKKFRSGKIGFIDVNSPVLIVP